jgi:hypothetical protein
VLFSKLIHEVKANKYVPFYRIYQDLGIHQDDMSLGIDVNNLASFCKTVVTNKAII